jgi:hypothetical protein
MVEVIGGTSQRYPISEVLNALPAVALPAIRYSNKCKCNTLALIGVPDRPSEASIRRLVAGSSPWASRVYHKRHSICHRMNT